MFLIKSTSEVPAYRARFSSPSPHRTTRPVANLAEAVEMAVDEVDAASLEPVAGEIAGFAFQARTLLGLLTFSYARQVYSSESIASQLRGELDVFCTAPDARLLQEFRAANRDLVVSCLRSALVFLAEEKIREGVVTHVNRAYITREAARRVTMAMFTDSLEACNRDHSVDRAEIDFGLWVRRGRSA